MELPELRSLWEESDTQNTVVMAKEEISRAAQRRSETVLSALDRAMRRKTWVATGIGLLALGLSPVFLWDDGPYLLKELLSPPEMFILTALMGILVLVAAYHNRLGQQKILQYQQSANDISQSLKQVVQILNRVQNTKIYSDAIGVPFFGGWLMYAYLYRQSPLQLDERILLLLGSIVTITVIGYYMAHWANKHYQGYIDQLKAYHEDLESG